MQEKIREIIEKHYSQILTELDEFIDTDEVDISIRVKSNEFEYTLN